MNYFKKKLQTFISWYLRRKGWLKLYGGQKYCWIMEIYGDYGENYTNCNESRGEEWLHLIYGIL